MGSMAQALAVLLSPTSLAQRFVSPLSDPMLENEPPVAPLHVARIDRAFEIAVAENQQSPFRPRSGAERPLPAGMMRMEPENAFFSDSPLGLGY
jgi:hypothetical protein